MILESEYDMKIYVEFADGRNAVYTYSVFEMMMSDDFVVRIIDLQTGERRK